MATGVWCGAGDWFVQERGLPGQGAEEGGLPAAAVQQVPATLHHSVALDTYDVWVCCALFTW